MITKKVIIVVAIAWVSVFAAGSFCFAYPQDAPNHEVRELSGSWEASIANGSRKFTVQITQSGPSVEMNLGNGIVMKGKLTGRDLALQYRWTAAEAAKHIKSEKESGKEGATDRDLALKALSRKVVTLAGTVNLCGDSIDARYDENFEADAETNSASGTKTQTGEPVKAPVKLKRKSKAPSIYDGSCFIVNILRTTEFKNNGVLFGEDTGGPLGLHWAVVDPRKHVMYVWQKTDCYFPDSAVNLGASVFTNGSFNEYGAGGAASAEFWRICGEVGLAMQNSAGMPPAYLAKADAEIRKSAYRGGPPEGYVFGAKEGISQTKSSRPELCYFGRGNGRTFKNYKISKGDPNATTTPEAIGRLFRTLDNYAFSETKDQNNSWGFWGLVPLDDQQLLDAGVGEAWLDYSKGGDALAISESGLIVTVFFQRKTFKDCWNHGRC